MKDVLDNGVLGGGGRGHELKCLRRQNDEMHDNGTTKTCVTFFVHVALLCRTPKRQHDKGKSKRSNRHGLCSLGPNRLEFFQAKAISMSKIAPNPQRIALCSEASVLVLMFNPGIGSVICTKSR